MPGIVVKVFQPFAAPDDREVARGCGAKTRPVVGSLGVASSGEDVFDPAHQCCAAFQVNLGIVAIELGGAGNAELVAQA